jgi:crotonobetainyl-CoA:carnitine CoA-transferase CaiB-like acyl-CoA transferase
MASGPLDGIRVLEFGQIIAAPLACQFLADLGADVIKVEPLQGEPWRHSAPFLPGESKVYHELNRGKRSLALDLSSPQGQEIIHRLMKDVDVVVINYRPDIAVRLRVDYESLSAIRPDLIYVDITAFGRKGDLAEQPGYDLVVQAAAGLLAATGFVNDRGVPTVAPPPIADTTTGYSITVGVCAALFHRARTGEGQKVETSLLANALMIQVGGSWSFSAVPQADTALREGLAQINEEARQGKLSYAEQVAARNGALRPGRAGNIYYRCYLTSDGVIAVAALSVSLRSKVRTVLGVEHNFDETGYDPRSPQQQAIDEKLTDQVEAKIRAHPSEYWEQNFTAGGVPVARVNFAEELIDHPQVLANDYVVTLEHELSGPERFAATPWRMSATPPGSTGASPPLGRDTDDVLGLAGYGSEEIAALRGGGIVR